MTNNIDIFPTGEINKSKSDPLNDHLFEELRTLLSHKPKHRQIITKQMSATHDEEQVIVLEDIRELMKLDCLSLDYGDLTNIWDINTWKKEPIVDLRIQPWYGLPCLVFHDQDDITDTLIKERVLALYVLFPEDKDTVTIDRVFLSNQRKLKDQVIGDVTWKKVYGSDMPLDSLKTTIVLLKSLGYTDIKIPSKDDALRIWASISEEEFLQAQPPSL